MNLKKRVERLEADQVVGAPTAYDMSWLPESERDEFDAILVAIAADGLTDELKRRIEAQERRLIDDAEATHRTA